MLLLYVVSSTTSIINSFSQLASKPNVHCSISKKQATPMRLVDNDHVTSHSYILNL